VGRDPDDVPRATTRSIGAHPDLIHAEPGIAIVAMARKLLIAIWRYATDGIVPEGAQISI
jgi:hypothetical protein